MYTSTTESGTRDASRAIIRVAIADRRQLIADALAALIEVGEQLTVVAVESGQLSATAIAHADPDVVLLGVADDPSEVSGLLEGLRRHAPNAQVALVADALTPRLVGCVLERGLGGLLLTSYPAQDLVASVAHIARGQAVLPSGWQTQAARRRADPLDSLSDRQLDVLRLLAEGFSYEEIGTELFISVNTVKFHMRSIFERLGVHNRIAAVRLYTRTAIPSG